jgi:hypothetical protein
MTRDVQREVRAISSDARVSSVKLGGPIGAGRNRRQLEELAGRGSFRSGGSVVMAHIGRGCEPNRDNADQNGSQSATDKRTRKRGFRRAGHGKHLRFVVSAS